MKQRQSPKETPRRNDLSERISFRCTKSMKRAFDRRGSAWARGVFKLADEAGRK